MFQTHPKALEELSFAYSAEKWALFKEIHEYLMANGYSTISHEEIKRGLIGVERIGQLQLEGKIYAFHIEDTWEAEQSGTGEGYQLFERRGNTLKDYFKEYDLPSEKSILMLKKNQFTTIYTGNILFNEEFLGIKYQSISPLDDHSMQYSILEDREIHEFESNGIQVIVLDSLI